jgi:starch synthase
VPLDQMKESPFEPTHPDRVSRNLAAAINELMADPVKREKFGKAGRKRAEAHFGWDAIARETADLYSTLVH